MKGSHPPKLMMRFFRWFCDPELVKYVEGDLIELYHYSKRTKAKWKADWVVSWEIIKLLRPAIIKNFEGTKKLNYYGMFKHYLKISHRTLLRKKAFTFINIGGLVMGLTITLLIALWIQDERSWNRDNENYSSVARVMEMGTINGEVHTARVVPIPVAGALQEEFGEDFKHIVLSTNFGDYLLSRDEKALNVRGSFMQKDAPEVLSLKMVAGQRDSFEEEAAIFLSESSAKAFFGEEDPLGKVLRIHNEVSMTVKGVYKDFPRTSSFNRIAFIGSWDFFVASQDWMQDNIKAKNWMDNSWQLFVQLADQSELDVVNEKIKRIKQSKLDEADKGFDSKIFLHPMADWHLRSSWKDGVQTGGLIQYVWWFGIIGGIVLLLACINFMNLSTAQSIRRAKEVGIRKSIGSNKPQLITQFLVESILLVLASFLLACLTTYLLIPSFNAITEKTINFPFSNLSFWSYGILFSIVVGILAGSYPALYLSSFEAIRVLKGTFQNSLSAAFFRKGMVVFQFTISIILIIGTLIISQQTKHAINRPLGYEKAGTISIEMTSPGHFSMNEAIKNDLLQSNAVSHFTQASSPLTETWNVNDGFSWQGMDPNFHPFFCPSFVNHSYGETIGWEVVEGRDFSTTYRSDSSAMIINEAAWEYMQVENPIGMNVKWFKEFKVIGVVKNILVESPFAEIQPAIYVINQGNGINFTLLRLNENLSTLDAVSKVEEVYKKHLPDTPLAFEFVSDIHDRKFRAIKRIEVLSGVFASLAIMISCLGVFGLASFMAEKRTKEIGIRKVLGASALNLWALLSREYIILVFVSCAIAVPIAYYALSSWLAEYSYRVEIGWPIFATAIVGAALLTLVTVSFKSLSAAFSNPVDSLKDE